MSMYRPDGVSSPCALGRVLTAATHTTMVIMRLMCTVWAAASAAVGGSTEYSGKVFQSRVEALSTACSSMAISTLPPWS